MGERIKNRERALRIVHEINDLNCTSSKRYTADAFVQKSLNGSLTKGERHLSVDYAGVEVSFLYTYKLVEETNDANF